APRTLPLPAPLPIFHEARDPVVGPRAHAQGRPHHQSRGSRGLHPGRPRFPHRRGRGALAAAQSGLPQRLGHPAARTSERRSAETMSLPLEPYTVIDLTRARSGPTCVRQLADMGAKVIQISAREDTEGDFVRRGFDSLNLHRNKRSLTLDLKSPRGVDIIKKLAAKADVVVENFRPDVKHRLGIDYETLSKINTRIIYGSISGFGQTGPYRDRPGYGQIAQGMGGLMSVTGLPGQGPVRVGIPVADLTAGIFLAQGILCALIERERSGKGQWVHTSLLEAMVTMLDFQAARWLIDGAIPPQAGNDHPTGIPTASSRRRTGTSTSRRPGRTCSAGSARRWARSRSWKIRASRRRPSAPRTGRS